jgi:hypothetical protein
MDHKDTDAGAAQAPQNAPQTPQERYLVLDVTYDPELEYGRELGWIAPSLKDAPGLTLTEDHTEPDELEPVKSDDPETWPQRKWAGTVDAETFERFAHAWQLDEQTSEPNLGMLTEYGHLAADAYNFDGMDWNAGGVTPIAFVSLYVSIPAEGGEAS